MTHYTVYLDRLDPSRDPIVLEGRVVEGHIHVHRETWWVEAKDEREAVTKALRNRRREAVLVRSVR